MTNGRPCRRNGPALRRRGFLGGTAALGVAQRDADRFLLGLQEHFATLELMRRNGIRFPKDVPRFDINDVGTRRNADTDAAGIDIQVLSALTPGVQDLPGVDGVAYVWDKP